MKDPYVDKLGHHVEPKHVSIQVMAEMDQMSKTIKRQRDYIKKLEARIEELISSKGIRELEARLADAEAHAQDFKKVDEPREWEKRVGMLTTTASCDVVKDFIRSEFKLMGEEILELFSSTKELYRDDVLEVMRNRGAIK